MERERKLSFSLHGGRKGNDHAGKGETERAKDRRSEERGNWSAPIPSKALARRGPIARRITDAAQG